MPSHAIRRERLEQVLDDHPDQPVILVRGPVGAGKTVLVSQWLTARREPCAWLSIDDTHDNETALLQAMVEAVEQQSMGASPAVGGRVDGHGLGHMALWDILTMAAHRLGSRISLVLDDVQRLRVSEVRHALELLVEHPPDGVRVVLISRCKPRLGLERARLRGDLVEITPAALRFDRGEINTLASTWTSPPPDAARLEQATLGWAAGLRLAQLEASAPDVLSPALPESDGVASEYVREELIDASSADARSFLVVSCWLPSLSDAVCTALLDDRSGEPPLTRPEIEALPIVPIASRPGAFRYPPILTRALRQAYRRRDPLAAPSARRRAANACRAAGEPVSAIELFLQADCADEAADACAELATAGESSLRRVDDVLRGLPEIAPDNSRWLPWPIRAAVAAGRVDEARRLLGQAGRAAGPAAPSDSDNPELVVARALVAEREGDVTTLLACADHLLEPVEPPGDSPSSVPRAHAWRVKALLWSGDTRRATEALTGMGGASIGSAGEAAADLALAHAWMAWFDGDMTGVATHVAEARHAVGDGAAIAGEIALLAGSARRERNQCARAVPLLQQARSLAASAHDVVAALAVSELVRCHRAAGTSMDALELVVSARAACPNLPSAVDVMLRGSEARLRLDRGDLLGAAEVLHSSPPGVDAMLLAARVALRRAPGEARELLAAIDPQTPRQAVETLLLRTQVPDTDDEEASASLIEAITVGEPLGLVRTFLDEGPATSRRISQLALQCTDRTVGRLAALACQELVLRPERDQTAPAEPLTARELAVLRMLPLRMSNHEMAAQLYISVNTLKTHVRAIYRKLDVPHRSEAVRRAKALQLV